MKISNVLASIRKNEKQSEKKWKENGIEEGRNGKISLNKTPISFEFFPPKSEKGYDSLMKAAIRLKKLDPTYVSITYGAGGSTREMTHELTAKIQSEVGLLCMAHLTCVGSSREELQQILERYEREGIHNILALRGDPPQGQNEFTVASGGFAFANELVDFIRSNFGQTFDIGVAGYPEKHSEAETMEQDLENLRRKVDAGANFIITQLFLDNKDFYSFREKAIEKGIHCPIIAGIMPVTDYNQVQRFTGMIGARIPEKLEEKLQICKDNSDEVKKIGIDWAFRQCEDLLSNDVSGLHFYTLNRSMPTLQIVEQLTKR